MRDLLDEKKIETFQRQVEALARETFGRDEEGDRRIEIVVVDRSRYRAFHHRPVPYDHDTDDPVTLERIRDRLMYNVKIAVDALDTFHQIMNNRAWHRRAVEERKGARDKDS